MQPKVYLPEDPADEITALHYCARWQNEKIKNTQPFLKNPTYAKEAKRNIERYKNNLVQLNARIEELSQ